MTPTDPQPAARVDEQATLSCEGCGVGGVPLYAEFVGKPRMGICIDCMSRSGQHQMAALLAAADRAGYERGVEKTMQVVRDQASSWVSYDYRHEFLQAVESALLDPSPAGKEEVK